MPRTFVVNTDTCDRSGSHWVAFHFPLEGSTEFVDSLGTHRKCSGPARSSSMRTRAIMAEVTGWRFTFSSWDPPNFSIRWETHWKRITAVSPTSTDRNTTTVRLKFNPTIPTPALPVLLQTETSRNEDNILRSTVNIVYCHALSYVINDTNEIVSLCYAESYFPLNTLNHTGSV